jgi:hypothetical protein
MMLFSVEIRCGAEDLVAVMSRMREWLDAQRFEPDAFRHTAEGNSVTIRVQFKAESEAIAFASTFSGALV